MLPPSHQVKFTVGKCLRKHPALLSSSEFKKRHAAKFLQPYGSQTMLYQSLIKPGPRLVLLRSPPDTGKTSLAPSLPDLFPDQRTVRPLVIPPSYTAHWHLGTTPIVTWSPSLNLPAHGLPLPSLTTAP